MPAPKNAENGDEPKPKKQPAKPPRNNTASTRRPPTELDNAISRVLDDARVTRFPDMIRADMARKAGFSDHHALRVFRVPRTGPQAGVPSPRQAWTVQEVAAYGRVVGMSVGQVLVATGLEPVTVGAEEAILADPTLTPSAKGSLLTMLQALRQST
jgi:hypothetical protein